MEFDASSLWYETSLTIALKSLKQGIRTDYHVFQHFPTEPFDILSRLGVDTKRLEEDGTLGIWDSFTETTDFEAEDKRRTELLSGPVNRKAPLNLKIAAGFWNQAVKDGIPENQKYRLHIDDNAAILLQYNDEKTTIDVWRTSIIPYGRERKVAALHAFAKGAVPEGFLTKFEAMADGIIDLKAEEEGGRIIQYLRIRMLRGKVFDSRWHRMKVAEDGEVYFDPASQERAFPAALRGGESKVAFGYLVKAFVQDYTKDRLPVDQSGWRTRNAISEASGIPSESLYGMEGKYGPALKELLSSGLVEMRFFSGQRGRGGEVAKIRITYDKEHVRRIVDEMLGGAST